MSAHERNRYLTTAVVFLLAFVLIGSLLFRSVRALAQTYTFRPAVSTSNTYNGGIYSTDDFGLARDNNLNTAAVTHTNADFAGNGYGTPDTEFTWSGQWNAFNQTAFFIKQVGLYVIREGILNDTNQWAIEYSLDGISGPWETLDDDSISGQNPVKGTVNTPVGIIPDDFDLESNLVVRTTSRQEDADDAKLNIYDIRVEAEWNESTGGSEPLHIATTSLPDANKFVNYDQTINAVGGNTPYTWEVISGSYPPEFNSTVAGPNYDNQITYTAVVPYTTSGSHTFTVKVTDDSTPPQTDTQDLAIFVEGLSIIPSGPDLPVGRKNLLYISSIGKKFDYAGGTAPYYWCWSGNLPPGMSLLRDGNILNPLPSCPGGGDPPATASYQANYITLRGTPTNDGYYYFTLKLKDSGGEPTAIHDYMLRIGSYGVTYQLKKLKDYIKGITYGFGATDILPEFIVAANIYGSGAAGDIYVLPYSSPSSPDLLYGDLALSPGGDGSLPSSASGAFRINISGMINVARTSGIYSFSAGIQDFDNPFGTTDYETYRLKVLERKTLLLRTPSSTAHLPSNSRLQFVVSAEGGAPSTSGDTALDGKSLPYYNYAWLVEPADGSSPPLDDSYGTAQGPTPNPPYADGPLEISPTDCSTCGTDDSITFVSGGIPVTGTYDITFWAQDKHSRDNPPDAGGTPPGHPAGTDTNDEYEFIPATVRIKVIAPGGTTLERETGRPTKLKQEQYR